MAMTEEQNTKLEELFKEKLQEQYNRGIRVGILTVSKIVSDKLNDSSIPFAKRIDEVKRFCKIAPGIEQKFNEIAAKSDETAEVPVETFEQTDNSENAVTPESEPSEPTND